jgi:mRNA interferase RelE/StbE
MWRVVHTRNFLKDMARLPQHIRKQTEAIAFGQEIAHDPFLGGRALKLEGADRCYRIRVGDYRIGLFIDPAEYRIEFLRVRHRSKVYRGWP